MTVIWNSKVDSQLYENLKWEEWKWGMHLFLKNTTVLLLRAVQYESLSQPEETIEMMCVQCHAKRRASARLRPIILSRLKGQ